MSPRYSKYGYEDETSFPTDNCYLNEYALDFPSPSTPLPEDWEDRQMSEQDWISTTSEPMSLTTSASSDSSLSSAPFSPEASGTALAGCTEAYYDLVQGDDSTYWSLKPGFRTMEQHFSQTIPVSSSRPTQGDKHPCLRPDCGSSFVRKYDLKRHNVSCHDISIRFDCPQERCDRRGDQAFTRKDHCQEHVKTMHPKKKPKAMEPSP